MRILVDGNHLSSRARYTTVATLCTSDGRRSGVIHGFLRSISWLLRETGGPWSDVTVVFDGGRSRRRMELFPEYKAGRHSDDPTEEEKADLAAYFEQLRVLQLILPTLGAQVIRVKGVEADDVISILAHQDDTPTYVFSGDKDFHQIASPNICIFDPKKEKRSIAELLNEWGARDIRDIVKLRAIIGDSSDNIGGVPRIGPKKSIKALYDPESKEALKVQEHYKIVDRNLTLMQLPKTYGESLYSYAETYEIRRQHESPHKASTRAFLDHCAQWELNQVLEVVSW